MTEDRSDAEQPRDTAMEPRFHQAHHSTNHLPDEIATPAPELLLAVAGRSDAASEQLQQQAAELAEHLQGRQRHLVRHEASLNARSAEYDDQQRSARLWLRERQGELDQRELLLQRQVQAQEERAEDAQQADRTAKSLAEKQEQVRRAEQALQERHQQLDEMLENVRHQATWLEAARSSWRKQCQDEQRTLSQLREQLLDQRQATEELNARLQQQLKENQCDATQAELLARQRRQLEIEAASIQEQQAALDEEAEKSARDQNLHQARNAQQRQTIAAHWRRRRQDLQRQRESLQSRQQSLDDQQDTLRRQQEELDRQRRELVAQQLVVRHAHATLSRQIPPEEFQHLERAVRQYVQQQLAAAERTIDLRKSELHELAALLQQQQETLKIRHTRLHAQVARRQRELDEQAAGLRQ